ncbi:uncharacterized protein LOC109830942 [Asparagus officinalis]|uniref:uncharacterized protein LOC109830942 n=1 Tax=Asparagus officinalis TaxID=4686 RepID=UPI00098DF269|nr:uncharacterized protein LOC109830942 [Asparagus officinalis]
MNEMSAKRLWEILNAKYLTKSIKNRLHLKKRFYQFKMKMEVSIMEHVNNFMKLLSDIVNMDIMVKDEDKVEEDQIREISQQVEDDVTPPTSDSIVSIKTPTEMTLEGDGMMAGHIEDIVDGETQEQSHVQESIVPSTFRKAKSSPNSIRWREAMKEEMRSLQKNDS